MTRERQASFGFCAFSPVDRHLLSRFVVLTQTHASFLSKMRGMKRGFKKRTEKKKDGGWQQQQQQEGKGGDKAVVEERSLVVRDSKTERMPRETQIVVRQSDKLVEYEGRNSNYGRRENTPVNVFAMDENEYEQHYGGPKNVFLEADPNQSTSFFARATAYFFGQQPRPEPRRIANQPENDVTGGRLLLSS